MPGGDLAAGAAGVLDAEEEKADDYDSEETSELTESDHADEWWRKRPGQNASYEISEDSAGEASEGWEEQSLHEDVKDDDYLWGPLSWAWSSARNNGDFLSDEEAAEDSLRERELDCVELWVRGYLYAPWTEAKLTMVHASFFHHTTLCCPLDVFLEAIRGLAVAVGASTGHKLDARLARLADKALLKGSEKRRFVYLAPFFAAIDATETQQPLTNWSLADIAWVKNLVTRKFEKVQKKIHALFITGMYGYDDVYGEVIPETVLWQRLVEFGVPTPPPSYISGLSVRYASYDKQREENMVKFIPLFRALKSSITVADVWMYRWLVGRTTHAAVHQLYHQVPRDAEGLERLRMDRLDKEGNAAEQQQQQQQPLLAAEVLLRGGAYGFTCATAQHRLANDVLHACADAVAARHTAAPALPYLDALAQQFPPENAPQAEAADAAAAAEDSPLPVEGSAAPTPPPPDAAPTLPGSSNAIVAAALSKVASGVAGAAPHPSPARRKRQDLLWGAVARTEMGLVKEPHPPVLLTTSEMREAMGECFAEVVEKGESSVESVDPDAEIQAIRGPRRRDLSTDQLAEQGKVPRFFLDVLSIVYNPSEKRRHVDARALLQSLTLQEVPYAPTTAATALDEPVDSEILTATLCLIARKNRVRPTGLPRAGTVPLPELRDLFRAKLGLVVDDPVLTALGLELAVPHPSLLTPLRSFALDALPPSPQRLREALLLPQPLVVSLEKLHARLRAL
eukprot:TRINITY_DN1717_c2_g1_i1.p1 TRINITY_DN1717_c2_g1~~TRINITY_DN1717_c2_g1_i1.p1  ORF type:complete len:739 (+),score=215.51 TRINITY_DN1717_c2_g1_i1:46-2262(+)